MNESWLSRWWMPLAAVLIAGVTGGGLYLTRNDPSWREPGHLPCAHYAYRSREAVPARCFADFLPDAGP